MKNSKPRRKQTPSHLDTDGSLEPTTHPEEVHNPPVASIPAWLNEARLSETSAHLVGALFERSSVPRPIGELFGAVYLALDADNKALASSQSGAWADNDQGARRKLLLDQPVRLLREARDSILLATPDHYIPIVQFRLERFIKATAARLRAIIQYRPLLLTRVGEDLIVPIDVATEALDSLQDAVWLWKFLKLKRESEGDALREELRRLSEAIASFDRGISVQLKNPVRVAEAAKVVNMRSDVLLNQLRSGRYPIGGERRNLVAALDHILLCVTPAKRKQLKKWAGLLGDDC